MDEELQSTELRIYFEFASRGDEVPKEDVEFVKSVLDEHGLSYDHYDKYNISTEFFTDTDENMKEVAEIESKIQHHFDQFKITRFIEDGEIYGSQPGTYQTWISIENSESPAEDADESSSDWRAFDE